LFHKCLLLSFGKIVYVVDLWFFLKVTTMFPVVSAASSHPDVDAGQPTASQSTSLPQQKTTEETTPSLTSLNLVSAEAEILPSTPATFSPETVRPFPKAGPRKMTNNRDKKKAF